MKKTEIAGLIQAEDSSPLVVLGSCTRRRLFAPNADFLCSDWFM